MSDEAVQRPRGRGPRTAPLWDPNPYPFRSYGQTVAVERVPAVAWVFVFTNVDGRSPYAHWLLGWFRPGFRHCFAIREVPGGLLLVQLTTARLQIEFFPGETVESRLAYTRTIEEVAPIATRTAIWVGDEDAWVPRGMNCVSVLRALAGMSARVQTPHGLFLEMGRMAAGRRRQWWKRLWWRWWNGRWCSEETRVEP